MLRACVEHPEYLGPLPCVELQVLRLLEVRQVATTGNSTVGDITLMFHKFLAGRYSGNNSLASRVKGNVAEWGKVMAAFVGAQRDRSNATRTIAPRQGRGVTLEASDAPVRWPAKV